MRASIIAGIILGSSLTSAAVAQPDIYCRECGRTALVTPMAAEIAFELYKRQMVALREEALERRRADGGTLSPDNREALQRRIDLAERTYRRRVRDFNPYAETVR